MQDNLQFGYPLKFGPNLISEIEFAIKNFDFIEFTLELDENSLNLLPSFSEKEIFEIKRLTENHKLISHFDWDINPFEYLDEIEKSIEILREIGIQGITMHSYKTGETLEENTRDNITLVSKINNFCKEINIELRIENDAKDFFSKETNFSKLMANFPDLGITLDVGHANKTSDTELDLFLKNFAGRIKHIHLHRNVGQIDHLFFENKNEFDEIISKILATGYSGTITLETHFILENGEKVYLNHREKLEERRKMFLRQSSIIGIKIKSTQKA